KADGERLGLQVHAAPMQHAERVARAMAQCQHQVSTADLLAGLQNHAFELPLIDQQVTNFAVEAYFAAQRLDLLAHGGNHAGETEGPDVGLTDKKNLLRRASPHEFLHDLAAIESGILDLAV